MTTSELHKILDDENKKLSLKELREVIYELKKDVVNEQLLLVTDINMVLKEKEYAYKDGFYIGEDNAFQIVLDLLEHLEVEDVEDR